LSQMSDLARRYHGRGFHCAQSVLAPFAREYGLPEDAGLQLSTTFVPRMGRLGDVCGALGGAFMAIGLKHGTVSRDGTRHGPHTRPPTNSYETWLGASKIAMGRCSAARCWGTT